MHRVLPLRTVRENEHGNQKRQASHIMNINRVLSGLLAVGYVTYAFVHFRFTGAVKFTAGLLLPLLCIWFSDAMGSYTGWLGRGITSPSPGILVCVLGWIVLLIPLMLWIVSH
jgi:hypothetical protein